MRKVHRAVRGKVLFSYVYGYFKKGANGKYMVITGADRCSSVG